MRRLIILAVVLWSCADTSLASVWLRATPSGGQAAVSLGIFNNYGDQYSGLIVTRYQLGTCEDPIIVTDSPITLPPFGESLVLNVIVSAPLANVFYLFEAMLVDSEGNQFSIADEYNMGLTQRPRNLAADGSAITMRGPMGLEGLAAYISPCADGCWGNPETRFYLGDQAPSTSDLWVFGLAEISVDITGFIIENNGMSGPLYDIYVESYEISPAGSCEEPVEAENHTWGKVKAIYR